MKMRVKRKRNYNARLFRSKRAYSLAEIAEILNTHIRTVQAWKKDGLKILDDGMKPFLAMGQDIQDFLLERARSRKKPLKPGEFFCTRCGEPRTSHPGKFSIEKTNRRLGTVHKQVLLRGVCRDCGERLLLLSSDRIL